MAGRHPILISVEGFFGFVSILFIFLALPTIIYMYFHMRYSKLVFLLWRNVTPFSAQALKLYSLTARPWRNTMSARLNTCSPAILLQASFLFCNWKIYGYCPLSNNNNRLTLLNEIHIFRKHKDLNSRSKCEHDVELTYN